MIDPRAANLLAAAYRVGAPRTHEMSVAQARHAFRKLLAVYGTPAEAVAAVLDVSMPRPPAAGGALLARLFRPHGAPAAQRLPVLLWFHGGGWTLGDVASYDPLCRTLANASGVAVFSVNYRLAPEHPFPAAVEDACFALDWLAAHGAELGLDTLRIGIGGDSAGGNLAAVATLAARDANWPPIRLQCLVYPATDLTSTRASHAAYGEGFLLDEATVRWFLQGYLPDSEPAQWRVSPLNAAWLGGLPPALLVTAACDPLTDDCIAYADALAQAGAAVERLHVPGMIHGFLALGKIFPQAGETIARIGIALETALA